MIATDAAAAEECGPATSPAVELISVDAGYAGTQVLSGINLRVHQGSVVALLGANGAGKTTLLKVASGLVHAQVGAVKLADDDVTLSTPFSRARAGLCLIPEGRGIFPGLTVRENLRMQLPPWSKKLDLIDKALDKFPDLRRRTIQVAGTMSGGQQQMLALCRAWTAEPRVVLLDEVSMGLAPKVVDEIYLALRELAAESVALLIVEQYVARALGIADEVYLLSQGKIVYNGPPGGVDEAVLAAGYLGAAVGTVT